MSLCHCFIVSHVRPSLLAKLCKKGKVKRKHIPTPLVNQGLSLMSDASLQEVDMHFRTPNARAL